MLPTVHLIQHPTLAEHGFAICDFAYLRDPTFQVVSEEVYRRLTPAKNATNQNPRGLRWGVFVNGQFHWLDRDSYSLTAQENPEEGGRVRRMDLIPTSLLRTPQCEQLFRETFDLFQFPDDSAVRAYEIQISAIRYAPKYGRSATPPPPFPHRDRVDGAIVVLKKHGVIGGINRLFDNEERALYEFEMNEGNGFLIRDARLLHYVSDVQLALGAQEGHRDILIVRFQPLGR